LSLTNGVHHFPPRDRTPRRPKGFETEHRTREPFHGSMILLYKIIKILRLPNDDSSLVSSIVVLDGGGVAATLINGDLLGQSLGANRFA
jgi:hypothetical protein